MVTEKMEVELDALLLDLENPRTGRTASQLDSLASVILLSVRNFRNMMQSIKEHGIDPGDSFYLIAGEESDEYIVVDGNRRLAALMVLNNPDLLRGTDIPEAAKRTLLKEVDGYNKPKELVVSCVLFESREDAGEWIERRHGRGLDGEGRIAWSALEIQRFQKDRTVLDVIDFVEKNSTFSDSEWLKIKTAVEGNTSSLRRFLESKPGKKHIGFISPVGDEGPKFKFSPEFVLNILTKIFVDISEGEINTRAYNKSTDIEAYFEGLADLYGAGVPDPSGPFFFSESKVQDRQTRPRQSSGKGKPASPKTKRVSPPRRTLAPSKIAFVEPTAEKGKQILREASALKLRDAPLSCALLFRAAIEYAVDTEMKARGLPPVEDGKPLDLQVRFERVCASLLRDGKVEKGDLAPIKSTLTHKNGPMSIGALNGYVHNLFQLPSQDELRNAWDHAVPLFTAIFGKHG